MLAPLEWIREYADVPCGADELARRMTFSGTKAEGVEALGVEIENVVTGKLLTLEKHPNADKLVYSKVDIGGGSTVQIVTGARNVAAGDVVPIALNNSRLPGGVKIKTTKMRGLESQGMMCSIQELNLSKNDWPDAAEDGIFILPPDTAPGLDIRTVLGLDDYVLDFEITTNRPDCLSMLGIAREAAVTLGTEFKLPAAIRDGYAGKTAGVTVGAGGTGTGTGTTGGAGGGRIGDMLAVDVRDTELCRRYTARAVTGVAIAPSPEWIKRRLRNAGVRPINNIVDITNYVMLEMGQPLHAFDARFVSGGRIVVRRAGDGELIKTLDGGDRALDSSMLVIADAEKPIAVAGVMGGANSEILDDTSTVIFEAANFDGVSIRRTARKLGMRTESSARFEKGLDPDMTLSAADRAVQFAELLSAGVAADGCIDVYPVKKELARVPFLPDKINALLGTSLGRDYMLDVLKRLEFTYDEAADMVVAPPFRMDISMEADLAEEIARIYDYNSIKPTLNPGTSSTIGMRTRAQKLGQVLTETALANGFSEIYTFSFQSPKMYDRLRLPEGSELRDAVRIANPFGEDTAFMRTTTLPSMFKILADNYNQRNASAALYEIASTYHPNKSGAAFDAVAGRIDREVAAADAILPLQRPVLTLGAYGGDCDVFTVKAVYEDLIEKLGIAGCEIVQRSDIPYYHPGRAAAVTVGGEVAGSFGEIHPAVAEAFSLPERAYAGTLYLDVAYAAADLSRSYRRLPKFPPVPRDLALVVDAGVPAGELTRVIRKSGGAVLEDVAVFDVYTGKQVPDGKKSVAFSLTFRSDERTLTDGEVAEKTAKIVAALEKETGAVLRT